MKKIKSFSIYGLFGTRDVHIPFEENIKILVGENGLGKTQVLNIFYYTLTRNFFRLSEFNFDRLVLTFSGFSPIEISKNQINELNKHIYSIPHIKDFIEEFGYSQFELLRNRWIQSEGSKRRLINELQYNSKFRKYSLNRIFRVLEEISSPKENIFNQYIRDCEEKILKEISENEILYFPTYRRVEEDLHNLGYDEEDLLLNQESTLIQFGMDDVQRKFNRIERTIDDLLKKGVSNFTKDILKIVISGNSTVDESIFNRINEDDLQIIYARAGKELDKELKDAVSETVRSKQFNNPFSGFLLQKLVELYEQQREFDNSIKTFRDVCNRYLIDKEVFYDESNIKIYIKSEDKESLPLSKLSSGEKQIISMFSKIYLSESDKRFVVLFDEPELSLSMLWQKQLLPDVMNSKKCDFLLAVTHSPFIFDNELDKYAMGLSEYIHPSKETVSL
ncbi:MAG: AAA family ATPase [Microscillaceae bacterium]|nr:AAA family ATPase [Microscillaceae bacterium]